MALYQYKYANIDLFNYVISIETLIQQMHKMYEDGREYLKQKDQ